MRYLKDSTLSLLNPAALILFCSESNLNFQIPSVDQPMGLEYFTKELTLCNKLWFSNTYIFGFQWRRPLKFQTMTSVRSNNLSLKYQRFTALGFKDIGIRKSEFAAKTQFLFNGVQCNNSLSVFNISILCPFKKAFWPKLWINNKSLPQLSHGKTDFLPKFA